MARTIDARFREKLFFLLRETGSKSALAQACGHPSSWVSDLLNPRSKRKQFTLADIEHIANHFRISIGELLGAAKPGELSGDEQRLVHAFRACSPAIQTHVLALIDQLSLTDKFASQRRERIESLQASRTQGKDEYPALPSSHDFTAPFTPEDDTRIDRAIDQLEAVRRDRIARQSPPGDAPREPKRRATDRPSHPTHLRKSHE